MKSQNKHFKLTKKEALMSLRHIIMGRELAIAGPGLFEFMEFIGKEKTIKRIKDYISSIDKRP